MTFFESFSKKRNFFFANQTLELKSYIKKMINDAYEGREAFSKNKVKEESNILVYIILIEKTFFTYIFLLVIYTIYTYVCFKMWPYILSINVRGNGMVAV